jgi:TetR/AcrR family transcriptional regulator, fatty acid metabolism regulator protein
MSQATVRLLQTRKRSSLASEKRKQIIEAAERLFADKGFHQTTIADISELSGVHEASIFQYLKNKENLLVLIPERHLRLTLEGISEHLQGMKGAGPKLRKVIWHQLRDLSLNRDYTSILLRDLRTMPAFYESPAYEMIRQYSAHAYETIWEGMRDGEIIPDLEISLALEMIFGAIDSVVLRWLFFNDSYDRVETSEELFSLMKAALWVGDAEEDDDSGRGEMRRRNILRAAAEVFGGKGYARATISEIAAKAGIAEASIYHYFESKEELLLSVPGNWFDELSEEIEQAFSGNMNPVERLIYLLRRWAINFQTREWDANVVVLELYRNPAFYRSRAYKNTHRFWSLIPSIVEEGREQGYFRRDFRTEIYLHLIQGTFEHEALARMMLHKSEATVRHTEQRIKLLIRAITA